MTKIFYLLSLLLFFLNQSHNLELEGVPREVQGRPGLAEVPQPHGPEHGAFNRGVRAGGALSLVR